MNQENLNAISWRCRRGMLELDLLLQPYFEKHFQSLTPVQQATFVRFLESTDPDLYSWLLGYSEPPAEFAELVQLIRTQR